MIQLTLAEVAHATGGHLTGTDGPPGPAGGSLVTDVVIDSRAATPGSLFVALPGEHVDGHDYVGAAAANGATAALVAREVPGLPGIVVPDVQRALGDLAREALRRLRAAGDVRVVAVTGSVGKTSTKDLLAQLLAPLGDLVAPRGSFNNEIGLPLTVLTAGPGTRVLVLEMGADAPGNLTYLTSIAPPDVAVVLAVGSAHLGGFGSVEGIAAAKSELVAGLLPHGVAVLNADDPRVAAMAPVSAGERVVTFGTSARADVRADEVSTGTGGHAAFTLHAGGASARTTLAVVGRHHVTNALAAAAVALELGRSVEDVAAGLRVAAPLSPHRMHVVTTDAGVTVIDDAYNANPDSMRAGLDALVAIAGGRRTVAVLGEMRELGDAAAAEHERVGRHAVDLGVHRLVVVGSGASGIHTGAVDAGAGDVVFVETIDEAGDLLDDELRRGDVVLVKSSNGARLAELADRLTLGKATA